MFRHLKISQVVVNVVVVLTHQHLFGKSRKEVWNSQVIPKPCKKTLAWKLDYWGEILTHSQEIEPYTG